jgi:hypothetical protein
MKKHVSFTLHLMILAAAFTAGHSSAADLTI